MKIIYIAAALIYVFGMFYLSALEESQGTDRWEYRP